MEEGRETVLLVEESQTLWQLREGGLEWEGAAWGHAELRTVLVVLLASRQPSLL